MQPGAAFLFDLTLHAALSYSYVDGHNIECKMAGVSLVSLTFLASMSSIS